MILQLKKVALSGWMRARNASEIQPRGGMLRCMVNVIIRRVRNMERYEDRNNSFYQATASRAITFQSQRSFLLVR